MDVSSGVLVELLIELITLYGVLVEYLIELIELFEIYTD